MGSRGQPEPQRRDWEMLSRRRLAERKQRRPQAPLRLGCQRTEPLVCLHYVRVREASACEFFWQSFIRLPRIGRKAKRDPAPTFHHPSHFLQSGHGVGPDLHRVDRHHLVKAVVIEWQTLNGTMPQVDTTAMDSGGVPSPSLFDHLQRLIDAGAMPPCHQLRQTLNNHTGSETDLQYAVVLSDLKETNNPGAAISIHARHDYATQPPQDALRAAKHAHQNVSHDPSPMASTNLRVTGDAFRGDEVRLVRRLCNRAARSNAAPGQASALPWWRGESEGALPAARPGSDRSESSHHRG
jgi:hypothetical protein